MKVSIVTISFNQARFLEQAICSVLDQDYPDVDYIVVDPGSTDGSREIIERYGDQIDKIIFEPDEGPADGLTKGFALATGDVLGFLNADDFLLPGALTTITSAFLAMPKKDVLSGHALIVDAAGREVNRFYSRRFSLARYVYGASVLAQQSTFFRAEAFRKAGGFNIHNRIAWDGELWADLALADAKFGRIPEFLAAFRVYSDSISGSRTYDVAFELYKEYRFVKIKGRYPQIPDKLIRWIYKAIEYGLHPKILLHRIRNGPTF